MVTAVVLAGLMAATPAEPVRLAAPGWTLVDVDQKKADFFEDYFAQQLISHGGFRVTTRNELGALIGFERQKQLLGCSTESTSCIAELTGALGVDGLVTGSIARTKAGFAVNVKIIAAGDARQLAAFSTRVKDDDELLDFLAASAKKVAADVPVALGKASDKPLAAVEPPAKQPDAEAVKAGPGGLRGKAWVPAAAGGALALGGAVLLYLANADADKLRNHDPSIRSIEDRDNVAKEGETFQLTGAVLVGVGAAAAAAGAGMYFFGAPAAPAHASLVAWPGGAAATLAGELP